MGQIGTSLTVVVAEADADLRKIIAYALRPYSDDIVLVSDSNEALTALNEISPTLIIMDMNLPGLNGANLIEHLHAHHEYSGLRVILTSSYAGRDIVSQLPPASILVQKPYNLAQLREAIDQQVAHA